MLQEPKDKQLFPAEPGEQRIFSIVRICARCIVKELRQIVGIGVRHQRPLCSHQAVVDIEIA